jgi:uncharacterized coiled-coil protein SlyX
MGLAGMAGLAGAFPPLPAQGPGQLLPIPELPKAGATPAIDPLPPATTGQLLPLSAMPDPVPKPVPLLPPAPPAPIAESVPAFLPATSDFRLQPLPAGNSFTDTATNPVAATTVTLPREEITMPLDRKSLWAAAFGTALSASTAFAQDNKTIPQATDDGTKAEKVEKAPVADAKKDLDDIKAMLDALTTRQKELQKSVVDPAMAKKVDDLTTNIRTLEETVRKLSDKVDKVHDNLEKVRTSFSSPLTRDVKPVETKTEGILKLVNNYGDAVTVIVNGKPIRLTQGETKDVKVPVGSFDYALPLAGGEVKTSSVKDNEIVTLKIK